MCFGCTFVAFFPCVVHVFAGSGRVLFSGVFRLDLKFCALFIHIEDFVYAFFGFCTWTCPLCCTSVACVRKWWSIDTGRCGVSVHVWKCQWLFLCLGTVIDGKSAGFPMYVSGYVLKIRPCLSAVHVWKRGVCVCSARYPVMEDMCILYYAVLWLCTCKLPCMYRIDLSRVW